MDVQQHETTEGQVDRLGQGEVLPRLGQSDDLGLGGLGSRALTPIGILGLAQFGHVMTPIAAGQRKLG